MSTRTASAPQRAKIAISTDGVRTIPTDTGIKLVRDLFEGIGVDRLRADRYFAHLSFSDVSELPDAELAEAVAVGLNYLAAEPSSDRTSVKAALAERVEAQLGSLDAGLRYRVGGSYSKLWPKSMH